MSRPPVAENSGVRRSRAGLEPSRSRSARGGREIYEDSYFSLVTDTDLNDRSIARFTEKILKPIANFQPFVLFGSPGELQLLRDEGFATCSPFIDESYDEIEDPVARFHAAFSEFERLCALSAEALEAITLNLAPRMEENYERLWEATKAAYRRLRCTLSSPQSCFANARARVITRDHRHCEERGDEAIQEPQPVAPGLRRCARNVGAKATFGAS